MDVFTQIEQTGFATWVRQSPSILGYPSFLFLHTVGLGLLVGASVTIDLRILGFGRRTALAPMEKLYPLIALGFWISFVSGVVLWTIDAATWSKSIVFYIKIAFIVAGMLTLRLIRSRVLKDPAANGGVVPVNGKILAIVSLVVWLGAITAGRLTAYIGK